MIVLLVCLPLPAGASAGTGGASAPPKPTISAISCLSTPGQLCPPDQSLVRGGKVRVTGADLSRVRTLVFLGRRGDSDDATVRPSLRRPRQLEVPVPGRARTGYVVAVSDAGRTRAHEPVRVTDPIPLDDGRGKRFFFDGVRKPSFNVHVTRPSNARIELVREVSGALVKTWSVTVDPSRPQTVQWDGEGSNGPEGPGRYRFRLAGEAASATSVPQEREAEFAFYDHIFPIRGKHNLGYTDTNNFGGGRNHRGQDMFAPCGTPLVAARGGTVKHAGYHSAAGYYTVIDGRDTGFDYVYMHMLRPPLVRPGQRLLTGQPIGQVGETGRAQGCHLHFELWTGPGWYSGGRAVDPLPSLKTWDAYS